MFLYHIEDHFNDIFKSSIFYCDVIVPLAIEIANGFAIIPNDVFAEPDGVSCDSGQNWKEEKKHVERKEEKKEREKNILNESHKNAFVRIFLLFFFLSMAYMTYKPEKNFIAHEIVIVNSFVYIEVLTMLNARTIHDCDWSGDGELSSALGELFGVDADELWNFNSVVGSGDPEDTLLKIEVIVSVPFSVDFCGACHIFVKSHTANGY